MSHISLSSITKSYGSLTPIRDLSLEIDSGEFVVLVGPSGCGKSTLLRMIAGLEDITGGELQVGGERFNDKPPQLRNIAMVFQSYALFPHMSVRENIAFGPGVRREDNITERVEEVAQLLNLTQALDKRPSQLSGGQRQRVAMGRAIVRNAKVFLFDEPLSNLDAKLRVQMRTEIKALHQKFNPTVVYVTHDQTEAMTMADRIVVMNGGKIEQIGPPLELYDNPQNRFVASFIGSPAMELLPGRLVKFEDDANVQLEDGSLIPVEPMQGDDGREVEVGIRPEKLSICDAGNISITVEVVEPMGSETHIYGKVTGHPFRFTLRDRQQVSVGQTLRLSADKKHVMVFDKNSGRRLLG